MNFPQSFLDEIRARLPVSEVVARRVKLTRKGREFVGLSPFNPEKTPSFTVNDQKGFYHCFSSGKHGDIFGFLIDVDGLAFPEAVERLAHDAGVPMPERTQAEVQREEARAGLVEVMEMAAGFFEDQLQREAGAAARGYLSDRGLTANTQKSFRLGYAPSSRSALKSHLAAQGVDQPQMIEAGLLIAGDDIPVSYDRFRDRVMFPIEDQRGRVIAFGGRALSADVPAKYLNSPETPLFHKGSVLYNFARARKSAHDAGTMIAVEGYMDVIALSAAGIDHAVAPLGTALTPDQIGLLWRAAPEPILCFDGDRAGLKAAYRAVETALPLLKPGHSINFALLPEGVDPDDLLREHGRAALDQVLAGAKPLADLLWSREYAGGDWSTPERRALLEKRVGDLVRQISDPAIQRYYEQEMRARFDKFLNRRGAKGRGRSGTSWGGGNQGWKRGKSGNRRDWGGRPGTEAPASSALRSSNLVTQFNFAAPHRELIIVLAVYNHPFLLEKYAEEFSDVELTSNDLDRLRTEILDIAAHCVPLDRRTLRDQLEKSGTLGSIERLRDGLSHKSDRFIETDAADFDAETGWRHTLALHRKSLTLQKELRAAELAFEQDGSGENFERLKDILEQVSSTDGTEAIVDGFGEALENRTEWAYGRSHG